MSFYFFIFRIRRPHTLWYFCQLFLGIKVRRRRRNRQKSIVHGVSLEGYVEAPQRLAQTGFVCFWVSVPCRACR